MKLSTFSDKDGTRVGVVEGTEIVDLAAGDPALPRTLSGFLEAGAEATDAARRLRESGKDRLDIGAVHLEAVSHRPQKYLAIGLNYADHVRETNRKPPDFPVVFNKQVTCVNGPYSPVHFPRDASALDYEGELAFVIGRRCRHVPRDRAHKVIAGYTIANDVSVRDWQRRSPTITLGKSWDTHGPLGPWLVTSDEIDDPHTLPIRTFVNGEKRQESNTGELIFDCYNLVETLSTVFTLEPGDVIATGTPSGVGMAMDPPVWLKPGDVVRVEIDGIGHIENEVIAEPNQTIRI